MARKGRPAVPADGPMPQDQSPVVRYTSVRRWGVLRAQIVGATGYGGVGIAELLLRHPEIRISSLLAKADVGKPLSAFYPHLRGFCDQPVEDSTPERIGQDADLVIFATPDGVGMTHAARLVETGRRVLE